METALETRIHGCLLGAAIGAELGFARCVEPRRFADVAPATVGRLRLDPVQTYRPRPHNVFLANTVALVDLGARTYMTAQGRATPETFGRLLQDDAGVAQPAFQWDPLHSVQETLKEGMHPRLNGAGTVPCGLISAAMPAVGIYHLAQPEYAYLDGVELASVAQPRVGADWAALCAVAVAAAFLPGANGETVVATVLETARRNCRDLFYDLDWHLRAQPASVEAFIAGWLDTGGAPELGRDTLWIAGDPPRFLLPPVKHLADDPERLLSTLVCAPPFMHTTTVTAPLAGAIVGALHGPDCFPRAWRTWAEPIAAPWLPLTAVVDRRLQREAEIVTVTRRLRDTRVGGETLLREKIRGCLLAGAIGNAMGSPVEGRMPEEIDAEFPGGITTVLDPSRLEGEDDNQMAMLLVETYLDRDGLPVMARNFGDTWRRRLNRNHFYPHCMGHMYDRICAGADPRITGHWAVVTGSTVMCMEPVGLYHLADPEFAAIDATAVSYMYQRGLDVTAAAMMAATVAAAMRPEATAASVCQAALDAAPTTPLRTFDQRRFGSCREYLETCMEVAARYDDVLAARTELCEKCLFYHMIDPLELWGLALAMLTIADADVRQSAIGGTNIGRDSDTIAGRAAMLAGAIRGAANVPREWIEMFSADGLARIDRNTDRLVDVLLEKKLPRLVRRAFPTTSMTGERP